MNQRFRESEFIDFNTGTVKIAPIQLQFRLRMAGKLQRDDQIRLFQCRVEVWHLGVAAQTVRAIEHSLPPDVWSHAAYGLLALLMPYFEMVGQLVTPGARTTNTPPTNTSADEFAWGFYDVYPNPTTTSGESYDPQEFYALAHQGYFARGSTPHGLWMHNESSISAKDFDIIPKKPNDPATRRFYVNPHAVVRTVIDHFPTLIARLNNPATEYDLMRARLQHILGNEPGAA